jgi:hypothetical protein
MCTGVLGEGEMPGLMEASFVAGDGGFNFFFFFFSQTRSLCFRNELLVLQSPRPTQKIRKSKERLAVRTAESLPLFRSYRIGQSEAEICYYSIQLALHHCKMTTTTHSYGSANTSWLTFVTSFKFRSRTEDSPKPSSSLQSPSSTRAAARGPGGIQRPPSPNTSQLPCGGNRTRNPPQFAVLPCLDYSYVPSPSDSPNINTLQAELEPSQERPPSYEPQCLGKCARHMSDGRISLASMSL